MKRFALALAAVVALVAGCTPGIDAPVTVGADGVQTITMTLPDFIGAQPLGLDLRGESVIVIDADGGECESSVVPGVVSCFFEFVVPGVPIEMRVRNVDQCRFWLVIGVRSFPCVAVDGT